MVSCWTTRTADCHFSMLTSPSTFTRSTPASNITSTPALLWKHLLSYEYTLESQPPCGLLSPNPCSTATSPHDLHGAMLSFSISGSTALPINQLSPIREQRNPDPNQLPGLRSCDTFCPFSRILAENASWSRDPPASQNSPDRNGYHPSQR